MLRSSVLPSIVLTLATLCCATAPVVAESAPSVTPSHPVRSGQLPSGPNDAITDVAGVRVGHVTLIEGDDVRTGVTAIIPHSGNVFAEKVPAAVEVYNGFGKLVGSTQVDELGQLETPILLTNTLQVWDAAAALVDFMLTQHGNEAVTSVNPVVGETNDGWLNDIRARSLTPEHFRHALEQAKAGPVERGNVGAGTGTRALGFKGGIGTASRRVDGYTVGVLVQANFGGRLTVDGRPVSDAPEGKDHGGSCMIVIATDAPLDARQLRRLARRSFVGMARTGASFSHGSGDYAIAFSTAPEVRIPHVAQASVRPIVRIDDPGLSHLFIAVADATQDAIYSALAAAHTMQGHHGHAVQAAPRSALTEPGG